MAEHIRTMIFVLIIGVIIGITSGYSIGYLNYQPELTARDTQILELQTEKAETYAQLQSNLAALRDYISASTLQFQNNLTMLQEELSVLTLQLQQATANYSITNLQLAAKALPFNVTSSNRQILTNITSWTIFPNSTTTIQTHRNSSLIILFSSELAISSASRQIKLRVILNTDIYLPNEDGIFYFPVEEFHFDITTFSFYAHNITAGTHTLDLQWAVTGSTGYLRNLHLMVLALPT